MSLHGWTLSSANVHPLGSNHSRPFGSSPTLIACRICDRIFNSTHSLIMHYESHQDEIARRRQDHRLRTNYHSNQGERRNGNSTNNPSFQTRLTPSATLQQRHHPYFPNGYRALQQQVRQRNLVARTNPFLASSGSLSLFQPRNPAANNSALAIPSMNPFSVAGGSSVANAKPFFLQQSPNFSPPKVFQSMRSDNASTSQPAPSLNTPEQKGFDESADKGTIWYLGKLEKPIPTVIDLESDGNKNEYINLDLRLKY